MKRVLIIVDDAAVGRFYGEVLARGPFETALASSEEAAWTQLETWPADAIVLDAMLPQRGIKEFLQALCNDPLRVAVPVVVLCNTALPRIIRDYGRMGVSRCVVKSDVSPMQLVNILQDVLKMDPASPPGSATAGTELGTPPVAAASQTTPSNWPLLAEFPPTESEWAWRRHLREHFARGAPEAVEPLRRLAAQMRQPESDAEPWGALLGLYQWVHLLAGRAALADYPGVTHLAALLELWLLELMQKPRRLTSEAASLVGEAAELVANLLADTTAREVEWPAAAVALVVSEKAWLRRAISHALELAGLRPLALDEVHVAQAVMASNSLDLVVLDATSPAQDGCELSIFVRKLPAQQTTPVLMVVIQANNEARARAILSGANDVLGVTFHPLELAVRAAVLLMRCYGAKTLLASPGSLYSTGNQPDAEISSSAAVSGS